MLTSQLAICLWHLCVFCISQEEIHELLLSFAEAGANVVRLKGGDPLVCLWIRCLVYAYTFLYSGFFNNYIVESLEHLLEYQVFGRGGEEMDFLQQKGIQVKVIPGMISLWIPQRTWLSWKLQIFPSVTQLACKLSLRISFNYGRCFNLEEYVHTGRRKQVFVSISLGNKRQVLSVINIGLQLQVNHVFFSNSICLCKIFHLV